jgi:hypothetical protein
MPLGVQLIDLRRELRAETGTSLNPAQGVQAQQSIDIILARQQRELWDAYNWPHLKIWADQPIAAGQGLYNYPAAMAFEQIIAIYVATAPSAQWQPLRYGIKPWMIAPSGPITGTPTRWRNVATVDTSGATPVTNPVGQFQIVPVPNSDVMSLRFEGQAPLNDLVADSDTCILDSKVIILFAAAEILAVQKSEAAAMKLTKAQNYLRRLLQDQGSDKRTNYNMGGSHRYGVDPDRHGYGRAVPYIDYIPGG